MTEQANHSRWVKISHWIITLSFFTLVFSGYIILKCHPRLYWGEVGNDLTPALMEFPISKNYQHGGWEKSVSFFSEANSPVSAGRTFDIYNQNGWGRSLHFLAGWFLVITGIVYFLSALFTQHFQKHLLPRASEFSWRSYWEDFRNHLQVKIPFTSGPHYNLLQKTTYLIIVCWLFPLVILTGLTMSPAVTAAYPFLIKIFFGTQSARTIHFFASVLLVLFLIVHIVMVIRSGFKKQILSMTIGK